MQVTSRTRIHRKFRENAHNLQLMFTSAKEIIASIVMARKISY
jgi:hypothetical protein